MRQVEICINEKSRQDKDNIYLGLIPPDASTVNQTIQNYNLLCYNIIYDKLSQITIASKQNCHP